MSTKDKELEAIRQFRGKYKQVFGGPVGQEVLRDLASFCRAAETTFRPDPREHALLEGRREVFLRIAKYMNIPSEQIYEILAGRTITIIQE